MRQFLPTSCNERNFDLVMDMEDVSEKEKTVDLDLVINHSKTEPFDVFNPAFHAKINHQVRNSMNVIMGFAQILNYEGVTRDDTRSYTTIICRETEQLLGVFNELLFNLRKIRP